MTIREEHGAKGKMDLHYTFSESASGHKDSTRHLWLEASSDGAEVLMLVRSEDNNVYKATSSSPDEVLTVSVDQLIAFFRGNGKKSRRAL